MHKSFIIVSDLGQSKRKMLVKLLINRVPMENIDCIYASVSCCPKCRQQAFRIVHYVSSLYSAYTLIAENNKCIRDQIQCSELFYDVAVILHITMFSACFKIHPLSLSE